MDPASRPPSIDDRGAPSRRGAVVACLVIAAAAIAVYANTLGNGLVYDDRFQVVENRWITDLRYVPDILTTGVWQFEGASSNYYRPVMHLVYMATYGAVGLRPWGYHAVNILLHVVVSLLVFLIARRLAEGAGATPRDAIPAALAGSLLFAVHPIHTEVVAWVAGVPELTYVLFCLVALLLHARAGPGRGWSRAGAAVAFFLALLSKETAITFPAIAIAYDLVTPGAPPRWGERARRYAPYAAAIVAYLALRAAALPEFAPLRRHAELGWAGYAVNVFPLFADYLVKLVLPLDLNAFHVFRPIGSILSARGIASLLATGGVAAASLLAWRRRSRALVASALIVVPLVPVLYIPALGENTFAERYLYLPSVGLAVLVALVLPRLRARSEAAHRVALGALAVVAIAWSVATVDRNAVWRDDASLWTDTVAKSPDSAFVRNEMGTVLADRGELDAAVEQYRLALRYDPGYALALSNLGSAYLRLGRPDLAAEQAEKAIAARPGLAQAHAVLASAYAAGGRLDRAIEEYRAALESRPDSVEIRVSLGNALEAAGRDDDALETYRLAVESRPDSADAHLHLGIALGERGRLDEAVRHLETAARLAPDDAVVRHNLANAYRLKGLPPAAGEVSNR